MVKVSCDMPSVLQIWNMDLYDDDDDDDDYDDDDGVSWEDVNGVNHTFFDKVWMGSHFFW